jgi:hypothetical protein
VRFGVGLMAYLDSLSSPFSLHWLARGSRLWTYSLIVLFGNCFRAFSTACRPPFSWWLHTAHDEDTPIAPFGNHLMGGTRWPGVPLRRGVLLRASCGIACPLSVTWNLATRIVGAVVGIYIRSPFFYVRATTSSYSLPPSSSRPPACLDPQDI